MRPTDKATADSRSVQSFAIIKNTGQGNFFIDHCLQELEMDHQSETGLCTVRPPHRHPFSDFFWGEGAPVHRLSGTDNPVFESQADCSFKIKTIPFQIKTYFLSDANHQTDNPSHTNNPSLV